MIEANFSRRRHRAVVVLVVAVALVGPAAPAQAHHRGGGGGGGSGSAPNRAAPLQVLPDLLASLLPGLLPPSGGAAVAPSVYSRVSASTVRVVGPACGAIQVGSGFAARADTAVTAAHVVAGMTNPVVFTPDGRRLPASVVVFDANRDLAVLKVDGLGQSPLPLGRPSVGTQGAVFGHPQGQPAVEVSPATVVALGTARLPNLYGDLVLREILRLTSQLEPGDSGGALVDGSGNVIGVAFAVSTRQSNVAFAVNSSEVERVLASGSTTPVSTGPCVD